MNVLKFLLVMTLFQNPVQQSQFSTIEGRITTVVSSDAIADARVELRNADNVVQYTIATEPNGKFIFSDVRPGLYRIAVSKAGFVRTEYQQRTATSRGTFIELKAGQHLSDVQIGLTLTGSIFGRIVDPSGKPVVKAEVQALKPAYRNGSRVLTRIQSAITDDLGEYRLFWLSPGQYYVGVTGPNWSPVTTQVVFDNSLPMNNNSISQMEVGAPVSPLSPPRPSPGAISTGRFVPIYYPNTPDDQAAQPIDVRPGDSVGGINIVLSPVRTRQIRGVVIDGDTGQPAKASVDNPQARFIQLRIFPTLDGGPTLQANSNTGQFDIAALPASTTIAANLGPLFGRVVLPAGDADINGVQIFIKLGSDIPGQLTIEGISPGTADARFAPLRIALRGDPGGGSAQGGAPSATGTFTLQNAATGIYRVDVIPILDLTVPPPSTPTETYVKSIRFGSVDVLKDGLVINQPTEKDTRLEIELGTARGSVSGVILDESAKPVSESVVVMMPDTEHRSRRDLYRTSMTDAFGRFQIDAVPTGAYKVFSWEDVETGIWQIPTFIRQYEDRGKEIHITGGATQEIQLAIIPAVKR